MKIVVRAVLFAKDSCKKEQPKYKQNQKGVRFNKECHLLCAPLGGIKKVPPSSLLVPHLPVAISLEWCYKDAYTKLIAIHLAQSRSFR